MTPAVRVDRVGGLDLETARAGAGPPILFLHGLGGNHRSWDHQLLALSSRYLCVAWAMPGYGRSATSEPYGFPALASAAAGLVAHLGRGPATIVGHSMGGFVAQELALRHPEAVSSLLLAGTTAAFGRPGSDFNRRFLADRLAPLDRGRTPADLAPSIVDGLVAPGAGGEVRRSAIDSMSAIPAAAYRRALGALVTWDATDRLGAVAAPTLCVAGEHDGTAPPRAVERLAAAIPGARYRLVGGAGHLMNLERPDAVTALVAEAAEAAGCAAGRDDQP